MENKIIKWNILKLEQHCICCFCFFRKFSGIFYDINKKVLSKSKSLSIIKKKTKERGKKQMKLNFKGRREKGITLIALVITIIVLLILAGVTITTLTGDNGILKKSNDAKEETRGASVEEAVELWKINKKTEKRKRK